MAISQNFAAISPTLSLNFARSKALDPRITFTRTTTGTVLNERGVIETIPAGSPRFDHAFDSTTGSIRSLGLLIEESRTNLLSRSEELDNNSTWATDNAGLTITANSVISPDGTQDADTLTEANTNTTHNRYQSTGLLSNTTPYTFSTFIKANTVTRVRLGLGYAGLGGGGWAIFNLSTGTVALTGLSNSEPGSDLSASMIPYPNGWYRCVLTLTPSRNNLVYYSVITLINSSNAEIYQGNTANNLYAWGAQLELGRFATSYIPTTTTAVTRAIDQAFMTGTTNFDNWFNPAQGTILIRSRMPLNRIGTGTFRSLAQIIKSSTYNSDSIFTYIGASGSHAMEARSGSTNIANINNSTAYAEGDTTISTYFVLNDCAVSTRGESPVTGSFGGRPSGLDRIIIGNVGDYNTQGTLNGTISHLVYYPRRLSNAQLQTLTRQ